MYKIYVTFHEGQQHTVNGIPLNSETIAEIECESVEEGVAYAKATFDNYYSWIYKRKDFRIVDLDKHYPKGIRCIRRLE